MTSIAISRMHFPVTTLGPGRRIGIWLQGCSIRCQGCLSVDTWEPAQRVTTTGSLIAALRDWIPAAEGITISGGEPFDQPEALEVLLRDLRRLTAVDILVYSGYAFDALSPWLQKHAGLIDVIISEPYDETVPQTLSLRGSDNQQLHLLTELGRERFSTFDRDVRTAERRFDVMFDPDGSVWLAGIPASGDMRRLRHVLKAAGHTVSLSDSNGTEASS
jgi:anaerobic ribonucleoside-triphosphate reductase activating protein